MTRSAAKFDLEAAYMAEATAFERIQINAMTMIIAVKAKELRELREERCRLRDKLSTRAKQRAKARRPSGGPV